ncbi:MAG TPA: MBL fold metallo-hydrolase [Chitinispirillaceae bacterium]|nr:MBL fold metallo-hydrolase [Chitinispirillaceae bacterium]
MRNEIKCEFEYHPVGQGLFYSGHLVFDDEDYTFVYDCGSEMREPRTKAISDFKKRFLKNKKEIDLLVISHLHTDHYNGIKQLLQNRGAKLAILPYMEDWERIFIRLINGRNSKWNDDFLTDPAQYLLNNGVDRVIYIDNAGLTPEETPFNPDEFPPISDRRNIEKFLEPNVLKEANISHDVLSHLKGSGSAIRAANGKWFFVFYNNPLSIEIRTYFKQILLNAGINLYDTQSITELMSSAKRNKVANAYKKVFGSGDQLNITSLITIHGPCGKPGLHESKNFEWPQDCYCQLLTGDFSFPLWLDHFCDSNLKLIEKIGTASIPHHGSQLNWASNIMERVNTPVNWVASFGSENKYDHPSKIIENLIQERNKKFIRITEKAGEKYLLHLKWPKREAPLNLRRLITLGIVEFLSIFLISAKTVWLITN